MPRRGLGQGHCLSGRRRTPRRPSPQASPPLLISAVDRVLRKNASANASASSSYTLRTSPALHVSASMSQTSVSWGCLSRNSFFRQGQDLLKSRTSCRSLLFLGGGLMDATSQSRLWLSMIAKGRGLRERKQESRLNSACTVHALYGVSDHRLMQT